MVIIMITNRKSF